MPTRIAHLSDIHFGSEAPGSAALLASTLNSGQYDLVVLSGDLTMGARHREFAAARTFMDQLEAPTFAVPGNHDITPYHLPERFLAPYRRWQTHISPVLEPVWSNTQVAVVGLNTARRMRFGIDWSHGSVSRRQLDDLPRRFGGAQTPFRIVVAHHPFIADGAANLDRRGQKLVRRAKHALASFAQSQVDAVLAGHLHRTYTAAFTREIDGHTVTAIQAGTALSSRVRGEPNSFNYIEIDDDAMTVAAVTLEGRGGWRRQSTAITIRSPTGGGSVLSAGSAAFQS
ncbi:MAG: metallophosphoesterase [Pseudomonadota bacterium]